MPFVIGIIVVLLTVYYFRSAGDSREHEDAEIERELLHLCLGDRELANRLVNLEIGKAPGTKRGEALRRAVHALRRDRK